MDRRTTKDIRFDLSGFQVVVLIFSDIGKPFEEFKYGLGKRRFQVEFHTTISWRLFKVREFTTPNYGSIKAAARYSCLDN